MEHVTWAPPTSLDLLDYSVLNLDRKWFSSTWVLLRFSRNRYTKTNGRCILESLERGIESSFIKMNNVSDQGSWEKYVTMEFNNVSSEFSNELDCYNLCQRGGFPCELFVFQVKTLAH